MATGLPRFFAFWGKICSIDVTYAPHPRPDTPHPRPKSGEERIVYRLVALTRMVEPPG